jgi:hypothetical protein
MMAGPELAAAPQGLTVDVEYTKIRFTIQGPAETFVAKPIRVRTRKGKDYHVVRITVPKEIVERLNPKDDDYLLLQARIAQWFHLVDWEKLPNVWKKLPSGLQHEVLVSGVFSVSTPGVPPVMIGPPSIMSPIGASAIQASLTTESKLVSSGATR